MSKHRDLAQTLADGVRRLTDSTRWTQYLTSMSHFHTYSSANVMLILMQCPHASRVAGYKAWEKMDRHVRKGEHGIAIFGHPRPVYTKDPDTGERTEDPERVFWPTCYVFDVSQTEGEPLPTITDELHGESHLLNQLTDIAKGYGLTVSIEEMAATVGGYVDRTNHIGLNQAKAEAHQAQTLAHEIGHYLLGHTRDRAQTPRPQKEMEAESVAYVVCSSAGLPCDGYTFGYLTSWSRGDPEKVETQIRESAAAIQKAAHEILSQLQPEPASSREEKAA